MTNERKCLACGRPLTGRQRKWCSNDDCEGYYALHPKKKPEYIEEQRKLQRIKFAQERLGQIRNEAKEWANDKRMKVRFESYIANAKFELGILNGTIEPFDVTCSVCDSRIETNLSAHSDYEDPKWVCENCKSKWFSDYQESVVQDFENWRIRHDIFRNLLYEKKKESTKIRQAKAEEYLAKKWGITIEIDETIQDD
jgi:DNA-directed RNA polymerase subunit RPC12/RpoP